MNDIRVIEAISRQAAWKSAGELMDEAADEDIDRDGYPGLYHRSDNGSSIVVTFNSPRYSDVLITYPPDPGNEDAA